MQSLTSTTFKMSQSTFSCIDNVVLCDACLDSHPPSFIYEASCSHIYCVECLRCMYISYFNGKEFAPRCCNTIIAFVSQMASVIGEDLSIELIAKRAETNNPHSSGHINNNAAVAISENHNTFGSSVPTYEAGLPFCNKCMKDGNESKSSLDDSLQEPAKKQGRKSFCKCNTILEDYDSDDCTVTARPCHNCGEPVDDCDYDYYTDPEIEIAELPIRETIYIAPWRRDGSTEDVSTEETTD
ncbi:hypothetical protein F5Y00DRAFT_273183 [Daldinia vernicosa]|uniref:uncharacterized protein n=1 Tax=Daldinia vernicosa TaxID=114800 RepID=UPI0020075D76|nr:uncharacterized protein F5Y00DRAFT_273183 [Daldinia vernicosa]KAI0852616.1 hypothetical protein F5Y00DRAFT_273183 [Daldinia vernicosa]